MTISAPPLVPAPRRAVTLVVGSSLALSLAIAVWFPLVDPDEGRNAQVSAEMAADGDVVVPHLAGVPYLDKPPALFAAGALAIRMFGRAPWVPRLPAIAASLLVLLLLSRAARQLSDGAHEWRTLALFASAPLAAVISAYVIFDMPLTLCVTVIWLGLALECERGVNRGRRALMFTAVGLGILVKGPVMLAWALGGSLAAAFLTQERGPLRWLAWVPGWLLALGLPGLWFMAALDRHPEYLRYAFLEESFERLTRGTFDRNQPWWFVPAVLVGGALPWSLATPWRLPASRATCIGAGFVLFAGVFFTFSNSKLVTYLLPAFPPLAWWAAECWSRSRRSAWALGAVLAFTPLLLLGGSVALRERAHATSGDRLARAILAAGPGALRYEDCYSPGTDFLLGRRSLVVSALGHPLTSNYAVRYRETLRERGQWTLVDDPASAPPAEFIIRERRREGTAPAGYREIFRDRRFVAWQHQAR